MEKAEAAVLLTNSYLFDKPVVKVYEEYTHRTVQHYPLRP